MTAVHQFVATFEPGAIGNEMVEAQSLFRDAGFESEIFAEYSRGPFESVGKHHEDYARAVAARGDDVLIYHMAIGSNVADWLKERPECLLLRYHNITPVEFYSPWPGANTYGMAWGRSQLRELVERTRLGIAASQFNRKELEDLHYTQTCVAPVLFDSASFDHDVDEQLLGGLSEAKVGGGADWLFVGWIAPHKGQHELIKAFAAYKKAFDPSARLHIVGRTGLPSYENVCRKLSDALGLHDSVKFHGRVSDGELGAFYRCADVYVSMSEHEGVGLPLLEAMHNNLPVVALGSSAVSETVGEAGIVVNQKRPAYVAAAVARVMSEPALRDELKRRGAIQAEQFSLPVARKAMLSAVKGCL